MFQRKKAILGQMPEGGSQSYFLESMSTLTPPKYPLSIHICFADSSYHAYKY